jgi:MoxR-like ATPase
MSQGPSIARGGSGSGSPRPGSTENHRRLAQLLRAKHACISVVTHEEDYLLELVRDVVMDLGWDMWVWSVTSGLRNGLVSGGAALLETEHPAAALYKLSEMEGQGICVMLDLAGHLGDERTLRAWREAVAWVTVRDRRLVMIDHKPELPAVARAHTAAFDPGPPDVAELEQIVRRTLRTINLRTPIEIDIRRHELDIVLRNLGGLTRRQAAQVIEDAVTEDRKFAICDLPRILARKRQMLAPDGLLEFVEAPQDMSRIGGMGALKKWLADRKGALGEDARQFGITPPRGVLLLGVQGAGKSLCAKAIATAWQRPLLRLDPGVLYDRYIGESERRLRDALRQAEVMAPIVLWIDEIEKGFASAATQSNDGGLSQRMFGTLLNWMQEHRVPVFLVATANNIDALPPELMRKGRFDEIFFVDLPVPSARRQIFEVHLSKRQRDPAKFDLERLAAASAGYSGAEIEQAVIAGLYDAFARRQAGAPTADLTTESLEAALRASPPLSVTMAERVAALRRWANGRCVMAEDQAAH